MEKRSPKTKVGQLSSLDVNPLRKIWCKNSTVSLLRKMELTSSCEQGGFFEEAAILNGLKKQETRTSICSMYSSSASTIRKTRLFLFRMLSAWGDFMYCSTICFQRRRQSHPRKKLCTFLIFRNSIESCSTWAKGPETVEVDVPWFDVKLLVDWWAGIGFHSFFKANS